MLVSVDLDLCQGHGVCESEAPAVFELGKNLQVTILENRPDESLRTMVEAAARFCPTSAIRITDKDGRGGTGDIDDKGLTDVRDDKE